MSLNLCSHCNYEHKVGLDMAARFELFKDHAGRWRWRLKDGNNVKVATSGESFASRASAKRAAQNVKVTAPVAVLRDPRVIDLAAPDATSLLSALARAPSRRR